MAKLYNYGVSFSFFFFFKLRYDDQRLILKMRLKRFSKVTSINLHSSKFFVLSSLRYYKEIKRKKEMYEHSLLIYQFFLHISMALATNKMDNHISPVRKCFQWQGASAQRTRSRWQNNFITLTPRCCFLSSFMVYFFFRFSLFIIIIFIL